MAAQGELAFVEKVAETLSGHPPQFTDDFQQPLENSLKKIPILPIDLPEPPERKQGESSASGSIKIVFKSSKPAHSYTLSVHPADTIAAIKLQLSNAPGAPPADVQRLLIKGKALADSKLLKEYDVKDGDILNLVVKPGYVWDPSKVTTPITESPVTEAPGIVLIPAPEKQKPGHSRIPSVVLSPSPSLTPQADEKLVDIPLILDTSNVPPDPTASSETSYHATIAQPEFWQRMQAFLAMEFSNPSDAENAWEDFFRASKGTLSVSEIAKIRDYVGVIGMAGT